MAVLELPKSFDDFVDARKASFLHVKEYVENGGHLETRIAAFIEML